MYGFSLPWYYMYVKNYTTDSPYILKILLTLVKINLFMNYKSKKSAPVF